MNEENPESYLSMLTIKGKIVHSNLFIMKKACILVILCLTVISINAQSKKELDVETGKEILKLLPDKLKGKGANKDKDKVKEKSGFIGVTVHRNYGQLKKGDLKKNIYVELINYSPSLPIVNSILSAPIGNVSNKYAVTVIDGYTALIQKFQGEDGITAYELLLPIDATLLTVKAPGYDQEEVIELANSIDVDKIAKKVKKDK